MKNRQSKRRLLGQLGNFDQDVTIGSATNNAQEDTMVNEDTADQENTTGNPALVKHLMKVWLR